MAFRNARLTASLLATAAVGFAAVEIAADVEARSELRRIVAAHPDLKIRSVRAEPFGGRLVLEGVEAGRGPTAHIAIGRLTLARPPIGFDLVTSARAESALDSAIKALGDKPKADPDAEAPPAEPEVKAPTPPPSTDAAIAGTATAENVVFTRGSDVVRIKRIDLTGTPLTNAQLASLLDPNSGESPESRLRKVTATSIVIPEIVVDDPTAGSEGHAVLSNVTFSGVVAGRATAVSVGAVSLQAKAGSHTTTGTVAGAKGVGVDFTQIAHVYGTARLDDGEPVRPLYDSVAINGVEVSDDKGERVVVASLKETSVKARPLKINLFKDPPPHLSKEQETELFKDAVRSFEIGSIEATGIGFSGKGPDGPMTFSLAGAYMRGFGKGRFGGFAMQGLRFDSAKVKVGLGRFDLGAFTFPTDDLAQFGSVNTMVPGAGKIAFDQLEVDVASRGDQHVDFKLAHISFASEGAPGEIPVRSRLLIDNAAFDVPLNNGDVRPLIEMGYRRLDLSARLATTYDAAGQDLRIGSLSFKGADMGSVSLGARFLNVTKGIISPKTEIQKASLMAVLVKEVTLDVVNEGFVDRAIAWKAKQDHVSVDAERATIIEFFDKTLPAQVNSANAKIVGSAVAKFIAAPKKLHIGVVSRGGFGAGSMALMNDPALLADMLEVTATAE